MKLRSLLIFVFLVVISVASSPLVASEIDSCPAERYEACSFFSVSRALGEHKQIIDNHLAGFTRSRGSWTINLRYQPETRCAKVKFHVDIGPIDVPRVYERELRNGVGEISDNGTFMHKIDDLESALRIFPISCRVPSEGASSPGTEADNDESPQDDLERVELEKEQERQRLAKQRREQERQRLAKQRGEQERQRIAEQRRREQERQRIAEEQRTVQERQRITEEQRRVQERQRIAEEQRKVQERQRIAEEQRRVQENQRIAEEERWERQELAGSQRGAHGSQDLLTGFISGMTILEGLAGVGERANSLNLLDRDGVTARSTSACQRAEARIALRLESQNMSGGDSMCSTYRSYARMLETVRQELGRAGCPASLLRDYDQAIAETHKGANLVCQ